MVKARKLIRSLISYIPGLEKVIRKSGTDGSNQAEYCFNIWRYHQSQILKHSNGIHNAVVGELGPGDSLGVGICAIFDGAKRYYGLDAIRHASQSVNDCVLSDLALNYREKFFHFSNLKKEQIRQELAGENPPKLINYYAPWLDESSNIYSQFDLVLTNAVLEHILDIDMTYQRVFSMLKNGGLFSNVIDYGAHEFSNRWFDHLSYGPIMWKFLLHVRLYPISRYSHSQHLIAMKAAGFKIIYEERRMSAKLEIDKIDKRLSPFFNDDDLATRSGYILAKKE